MSTYLYALDLAMECSGVTIFEIESLNCVYVGNIKTDSKKTHGKRLKHIEDEFIKLVNTYAPSVIAIERGFGRFNTSTQVIYRVHGVVNKFFHDYEQVYYPPKTVKATIVVGSATKKKVQEKILEKYPDVVFADENESDAFAVGLTWLIKNKKLEWRNDIKPKVKRKKVKVE